MKYKPPLIVLISLLIFPLGGAFAQWTQQSALHLLEQENTVHANQALAATYLADGNLTAAQAKWNAIPGNTLSRQQWKALTQMLMDLAAEGKTVFGMNTQQEQLVRNLAYSQGPASLAISNAQAILRLVYGEEFPFDLSLPGEKAGHEPQNNSENEKGSDTLISQTLDWRLGDNIPNPFSNSTVIPYQVPEGSTGLVKIYGIRGELVNEYRLLNGKNKLEISFANVSDGMYFYCLFIDGVKMQTKRMTVMMK